MTSEPILVNAALAGIGLLMVWVVHTLVGVRDMVRDVHLLLTHEEVGVIPRLKAQEVRGKRHSDALRAANLLGDD